MTDVVDADDKAKERQVQPVLRRVRRGAWKAWAKTGNRERLAKLLRFASTQRPTSVSFTDHKARMKEGQEAIYYITADYRWPLPRTARSSEVFKKRASRCCS